MYGRLGDAVHVDQARLCVSVALDPRFERLQFERFTREDDFAQSELRRSIGEISLDQLAECGRGLAEDGHLFFHEQVAISDGIAAHPVGNDDNAAAME